MADDRPIWFDPAAAELGSAGAARRIEVFRRIGRRLPVKGVQPWVLAVALVLALLILSPGGIAGAFGDVRPGAPAPPPPYIPGQPVPDDVFAAQVAAGLRPNALLNPDGSVKLLGPATPGTPSASNPFGGVVKYAPPAPPPSHDGRNVGSAVGAGIGAVGGSILGPLAAPLGAVGGFFGGLIGGLFD